MGSKTTPRRENLTGLQKPYFDPDTYAVFRRSEASTFCHPRRPHPVPRKLLADRTRPRSRQRACAGRKYPAFFVSVQVLWVGGTRGGTRSCRGSLSKTNQFRP